MENENEKIKVAELKECPPERHLFKVIPSSANIPLIENGCIHGLGFKTWECIHCDKKVKSS
jgi:hypothetical protein